VNPVQKKAETLKRISQSLLNLPTLPTLAAKLLELVDQSHTSAQTLAQFISQDQVIAARLLKMSNSAYYGQGREISSVHQAVVLLGFDMVREIALGVSVLNAFKSAQGLDGFDISSFWDHCSAVALVSRKIAKGWIPHMASEAFTAGLLHDIGKVVLIQYLPDDFAKCLVQAKQENRNLHEVEREIFGTDHGQIGSWLAQRWKLPEALHEVMEFHHEIERATPEHRDLIAVVQLSDILCRLLKAGNGGNPAAPILTTDLQNTLQSWGIQPSLEGLRPLLLDLREDLQQLQSLRDQLVG